MQKEIYEFIVNLKYILKLIKEYNLTPSIKNGSSANIIIKDQKVK